MPAPCSPWSAPRAEVEVALKELRGVRRLRFTGATESLTRFELQAAPGMHVLPELGALAQARGWQVGELQERPPTSGRSVSRFN